MPVFTRESMLPSKNISKQQKTNVKHLIRFRCLTDQVNADNNYNNKINSISGSSISSRSYSNNNTVLSFTMNRIIIFVLLLSVRSIDTFDDTAVLKTQRARSVTSFFKYNCDIEQNDDLDIGTWKLHSEPIGLQFTNHFLHQMITRIFAIFLKEALYYSNITLMPIEFTSNFKDVSYNKDNSKEVFDWLHPNQGLEDMAMINMVVWTSPIGLNHFVETISEAGSSMTAGRFGWFVPVTQLNGFDKKRKLELLHYSVFMDPLSEDYQGYVIDTHLLDTLPKNSSYTNPYCKNITCVTLLAGDERDTAFVTRDIEEIGLYVNIFWLGSDLNQSVAELSRMYRENGTYKGQRFIVSHWTPSNLIKDYRDFYSISMPKCDDHNSLAAAMCKYELTPVLKFYSKRLEVNDNELLYALRKFYIYDSQHESLYSIFEEQKMKQMINQTHLDDIYNAAACEWLKRKVQVYKDLKFKPLPVTLLIGGIFPMNDNSRGHENLIAAVERALAAINKSDTILRSKHANYTLQLRSFDGECRSDVVMKGFIYFFNEPNLLGILGPACSETVEPVAGISKHAHMPVVSYSAEGASFGNRHTYPYFFRTIGSNFQYVDVYIHLMRSFQWHRVAALTEDGQKYTEYISHMEEMKLPDLEFIINKKFLSDITASGMNKHLLDLRQKHAKIIIADIHNRSAELALCEAYKLGMTARQGYVWFLPPWISKDWKLLSKRNNNSCSSAQFEQAYDGHFTILHSPFGNRTKKMQENITIQNWLDNWSASNLSVSNYIGFAYDAVWAYAVAADKLLKENRNAVSELRTKHVAQRFAELIAQTEFDGLSGRVRFDRGGSRITNVDIMQWQGNEFKKVGNFYPTIVGEGNDTHTMDGRLELLPGAINWLSDEKPPRDGTYDCNFSTLAQMMGVSCDDAAVAFIAVMCLIAVIIISVTSFLFWKKRYDSKLKQSAKIMKNFGIDLLSPSKNMTNTLDKWEVPKENVVLNRVLGEGAFGTVYGGEAQLSSGIWTAVAVKTLKAGASTEDRLDFLSEAEAMKRFDHKNIVNLLGVCLQSEPIYTIMEFMLYGDLKTYLLARRHMVNEKLADDSDISPKRLTNYAIDVARGLQYLAQQKYVHRDLACRNCLVSAQRVVKLGDFGMARRTYESDYYRFNKKGKLPVRWMAPESLALGMFTTASDVWAFGVVLFEIITFSSVPFQGLTNNQVMEYVKKGNTVQVPAGVKPHLEGLMKACWSPEPKKRPTAKEIIEYISNHPRLLAPCLDFPSASVEMPETESDQLELLPKARKGIPIIFKDTSDQYKITQPMANNNNYVSGNNVASLRPIFEEFNQSSRHTEPSDVEYENDVGSDSAYSNYAQVFASARMNIPNGISKVHDTAISTDTFTTTTPDGYSIMSPLLMNQPNPIETIRQTPF